VEVSYANLDAVRQMGLKHRLPFIYRFQNAERTASTAEKSANSTTGQNRSKAEPAKMVQ